MSTPTANADADTLRKLAHALGQVAPGLDAIARLVDALLEDDIKAQAAGRRKGLENVFDRQRRIALVNARAGRTLIPHARYDDLEYGDPTPRTG